MDPRTSINLNLPTFSTIGGNRPVCTTATPALPVGAESISGLPENCLLCREQEDGSRVVIYRSLSGTVKALVSLSPYTTALEKAVSGMPTDLKEDELPLVRLALQESRVQVVNDRVEVLDPLTRTTPAVSTEAFQEFEGALTVLKSVHAAIGYPQGINVNALTLVYPPAGEPETFFAQLDQVLKHFESLIEQVPQDLISQSDYISKIAHNFEKIASAYNRLEKPADALHYYKQALRGWGKLQTEELSETSEALSSISTALLNMANIYSSLEPKKALDFYHCSLEVQEHLGDASDARQIGYTLYGIGATHLYRLAQPDQAIECLALSLENLRAVEGEGTLEVGYVLNSLGDAYFDLSQYGHAKVLFEQALAIYTTYHEPLAAQLTESLAEVEAALLAERL